MTINTMKEFRHWVNIQLALKDMTKGELAKKMNIPQSRISEALHGKSRGKKYILPIIFELGGDRNDFKNILKTIKFKEVL